MRVNRVERMGIEDRGRAQQALGRRRSFALSATTLLNPTARVDPATVLDFYIVRRYKESRYSESRYSSTSEDIHDR